jgi:ABC-type multidrug transport system fused ATPase/permease subunit
MNYVLSIAKEYKYELLLIYFYMFVAQLLFLLQPYVLGKMVDGLLNKEYFWLFCFIGIAAVENAFIYRRMIYDTKVYTKIYSGIVLKYLKRDKDSNPSTRIARTELSGSIIKFLEDDVQYYIYAILGIFGSLFFIFLQSPMTAFVVLSCTFPIFAIVKIFYKKIAQVTRVNHNNYERKVQVLADNNEKLVETFYRRRRKILIYQSTLQGKNWTSLNITKTAFLIAAIIIFTSGGDISQGDAVAMYAYVNQFLGSLMSIPVSFEIIARMKDIIGRIKE